MWREMSWRKPSRGKNGVGLGRAVSTDVSSHCRRGQTEPVACGTSSQVLKEHAGRHSLTQLALVSCFQLVKTHPWVLILLSAYAMLPGKPGAMPFIVVFSPCPQIKRHPKICVHSSPESGECTGTPEERATDKTIPGDLCGLLGNRPAGRQP